MLRLFLSNVLRQSDDMATPASPDPSPKEQKISGMVGSPSLQEQEKVPHFCGTRAYQTRLGIVRRSFQILVSLLLPFLGLRLAVGVRAQSLNGFPQAQ
jgi:hypothetical protein